MNQEPIEAILRASLEDSRLSRGEKGVLTSLVQRIAHDDRQLAVLRSQAFDMAAGEVVDPTAKEVLGWLEGVMKALQPKEQSNSLEDEVLFTPGDDCPRRIGNLLRQAQRKADICVFTITDDRISDEILAAHKRNVQIRILTDNDKSNDAGSDIDRLGRAGVHVRQDITDYHMHHKFAVFDEKIAVSGSYNWTRGAAEYNTENLLLTHNRRVIGRYSTEFERLWGELVPR